ncbi:MAG: glycosyltransferase [Lachnospiraceae bacterium]|nr:glycosyltransferase [Lachnospiraceae bacterium]
MKELSVIIPAYNVENYIENCLQCLLSQLRENWEIICIDDGSQDNTYAILTDYAKRNKNLRIIRNEKNSGAARSRNTGLEAAEGEYVIFLDSDDLFDSNFLWKMYDRARNCDADMVVCQHMILKYDAMGQKREEPVEYTNWEMLPADTLSKKDCFPLLYFMVEFIPWNKLVKRKVLKENHIYFQNLPNSNDVCYSILATTYSDKICFLKEHLIFYRENRENSLSSGRMEKRNYTIYAFEHVFKELEERGLYTGLIKACLVNFVIYWTYNFYNQCTAELYKTILRDIHERLGKYLIKENVQDILYSDWCYYQYRCVQGKEIRDGNVYLIMREAVISLLQKNREKRIALWGAGKMGRRFIGLLEDNANYICSIIDNDSMKQGNELNGIPIISYEESVGKTDMVILLNRRYKKEILQQIGTAYAVLDFWQYAQFGFVPSLEK